MRSIGDPNSWLAGEVGRTDPGSEAWSLLHWLFVANKQHMFAIAGIRPRSSADDHPADAGAGPRKMSELANALFCDNSNVTGIVDRLEGAGSCAARPPQATAASSSSS